MSLSLHIERLVLDGLPISATQGPVVRAALETELQRLMEERGLANISGGAFPHLTAPAIQVSPAGTPGQWGLQIARSLFDGLTPAASASPRARGHRPAVAAAVTRSTQSSVNPRNPSHPT